MRAHIAAVTVQNQARAMTEPTPIRFNLSAAAAGNKRPAESSTTTRSKVPKVSEMKIMEPRTPMTRVSTTGPVNICIYKITDNAGDLWALYKDSPTKLWQIQIEHDARPALA